MHFFFPDLEPPIINIQYRWSRIYGHVKIYSVLISLVTSQKLIILNLDILTALFFIMSLHLWHMDTM